MLTWLTSHIHFEIIQNYFKQTGSTFIGKSKNNCRIKLFVHTVSLMQHYMMQNRDVNGGI